MNLNIQLHLVLRLRMGGAIPALPNTSSWRGAQLSSVCVFMALCLVKHRNKFASYLLLTLLSGCPFGTGSSSLGLSGRGMWLTTHLHLVPG